ncbi:hypothetical protein RJ639_019223, partial [Escallonia herrerae]
MQPTGGGGELSRGLARFRSAPATWLEALLEEAEEEEEEEEDVIDPPKPPTQCLNHVRPPTSDAPSTRASTGSLDPGLFVPGGGSSSSIGFLRQNSSPADLLAQISSGGPDGYFSTFGIPASYDYLSAADASASGKRPPEVDSVYSEDPSPKHSSQLKAEQGGQLHGGLMDAEMEKLLEDSVPCRARAKRGCATHPRSIAERVRRTRISDRIRKLQELVPNMDKQTNTADMLEEAVEYVKFLRRQIQ